MNKSQLRVSYKVKRQELTDGEYLAFNEKIKSLFFQKFSPLSGKIVHSFLPVKKRKEIDTWPIITRLGNEGVTVAVPKADVELLQLTNHIFDRQTQLEDNEWGVPEPCHTEKLPAKAIDLVLLPLLSFDKRGYRVGYGKGFYDRFLSQCRADTLKIGLSFFPPVPEIIDVDQFDVRMDYCITPDRVFRF